VKKTFEFERDDLQYRRDAVEVGSRQRREQQIVLRRAGDSSRMVVVE
jgi:hypothetical protein